LGTKPSVIIDAIYCLDYVTIRHIKPVLNSLRKDDVEAQVEFTLFTLKVPDRARVTCY